MAGIILKNHLTLCLAQLAVPINIAFGIVIMMASAGINAAHRPDHFRGKEDILFRDHLQQQVNAVLMIDTSIKKDIVQHPLIPITQTAILGNAAEPAPMLVHRPAAMRDDKANIWKILKHI